MLVAPLIFKSYTNPFLGFTFASGIRFGDGEKAVSAGLGDGPGVCTGLGDGLGAGAGAKLGDGEKGPGVCWKLGAGAGTGTGKGGGAGEGGFSRGIVFATTTRSIIVTKIPSKSPENQFII